jgi:hypothetical protein
MQGVGVRATLGVDGELCPRWNGRPGRGGATTGGILCPLRAYRCLALAQSTARLP